MRVYIPSPLRSYTNDASEVDASGGSVAAVLEDLNARYPGIRFRIVDEQGSIRQHIKIFVAGDLAASLAEPVDDRAEVYILCALSGG